MKNAREMVSENRVLQRIYEFWGRKPKEAENANNELHNLETVCTVHFTCIYNI
jgi:hypothetical protein